MAFYMIIGTMLLFIVVFTFDISFNLRRLIKNADRLWRKLTEINDVLQNKLVP